MRLLIFLIFFFFSLLFWTGSSGIAKTEEDVQFKDITLTTSNTHLLLFAVLQNNKQQQLEQALHSGIPMQFTFLVELIHIRENWPDKELSSLEFVHTLRYDTLKEYYQLDLEEQGYRKTTFTDLSESMKIMNEINGLKITELAKLEPDNAYELRIKAELYEKTLPMNLHYVIPFISLGDLKTDWYTIEFTY